jgi:iron complex outermembrane receptor protein
LSALLYTQTSPGRGETGSDISGIPIDAIKDIQVLRDGASAQYGSDAIAGVINIILKDSPKGGSATLRTGLTAGDGEMIGVSLNNGSSIGDDDDRGFINYTVDFLKQMYQIDLEQWMLREKLQILEQTLQMLENF